MVRNIVVGYDGTHSSEVAVEQAIALAQAEGGRLYLATVTTVSDADLGDDGAGRETEIADLALGPAPAGDDQGTELVAETALDLDRIHRRCREMHLGCEEEQLFGRRSGGRLLQRSRTAELLVIGRGGERRPGAIGRNVVFLLSELVAPTLVCARQYVELRSILLPYKLSASGTRALSLAAELGENMNAHLHVLVCEPRRTMGQQAAEAAARHLRAYHVESDVEVSPMLPHEAVRSAALEREASLIVIPGAHKRHYVFPWQRNETLWRALEVPGALVLAYP